MKSICRVSVHCQQVWCTRNTIQRCSKVSCLHAQPLHAQLLLVRSQDEEHVQQCCQRNATMVLCNASKQVCKSASLVHKGQILERLCASLRMLNQCCCSLNFKPHWQTVYQKKQSVPFNSADWRMTARRRGPKTFTGNMVGLVPVSRHAVGVPDSCRMSFNMQMIAGCSHFTMFQSKICTS